jgi:hypothetical protein
LFHYLAAIGLKLGERGVAHFSPVRQRPNRNGVAQEPLVQVRASLQGKQKKGVAIPAIMTVWKRRVLTPGELTQDVHEGLGFAVDFVKRCGHWWGFDSVCAASSLSASLIAWAERTKLGKLPVARTA